MADTYLYGGDAETLLELDAQDNLLGVHQSDVLIRSALILGMADIRKNPFLLDHIFGSLPNDLITNKEYGKKQVDAAKKWFLNTNIPVFMNTRLDEAKFPCITIALLESNEDANTFGDIHYKPYQELDGTTPDVWAVLAGPFTPTSYDYVTGEMVLPDSVVAAVTLSTKMVIVDASGTTHAIEDASDIDTITLAAGTVANFAGSTIRIARPPKLIAIESVLFKETYAVGCHTQGESVHLTWLHSIITFILLRYREELLEARGFERSVLSSGDFSRNEMTENELTYVRFIKIAGYVRTYWPKSISDKITGVETNLSVDGAETLTYPDSIATSSSSAVTGDLTVFWGYAPDGAHNSAFVTGLSDLRLQESYNSNTYAFGVAPASPANYFWVALPVAWTQTASFRDQNGDLFPMTKVDAAIDITGYGVDYALWRSDNIISGYAFTLEARNV